MIDRENKKVKHSTQLQQRKLEKEKRSELKPKSSLTEQNSDENLSEVDIKAQINDLKQERDKLMTENKKVSEMTLKMNGELSKREENVEKIKTQSNELKIEVTNFSKLVEQLKHDKEKLEYEVKAKKNEINIDITNQKNRVETLKKEALLLNEDIEENEVLKSKLYSSVETLKSEVEEIKRIKEVLSVEIENKQEEINNVNSELFIDHYKKYYEVNKKQIDEELMTLTETDVVELLVYRSDIIKHEFPLTLVHKLVKNEIDKI